MSELPLRLPGEVSSAVVEALVPSPRAAVHDVLPLMPDMSSKAARRLRGRQAAATVDVVLTVIVAVTAVVLAGIDPIVSLCAAAAWPPALWAAGHYRRHPLGERPIAHARRVFTTGFKTSVVALATLPWLTGSASPVDVVLLLATLSAASGVPSLLAGAATRPRMVLAGDPEAVRAAMVELLAAGRHEIVAVCLTHPSDRPFGDLPTYVGMGHAAMAADQHDAEALVILPGSHLSSASLRRLEWAAAGVGTHLYMGTGLLDVAPARTSVLATAGLGVVHVAPAVLGGPRRLGKDVLERLAAAMGLLMVLPLLVTVAVLIRLDTPGPAVFRQQRVGRDGKAFTMLKFRSMSTTAEKDRTQLVACNESDGGMLFKIQQDPRVTRVGTWLRRYSLDELPQLWNVVRGDMSLVGPRPALPDEVSRYDLDPRRRLLVKPGLTGLWQVSGRSDLSWDESVRLDLRYVENWSLRLDAWILVRTVRAVLGHQGAY